MIVPKTLPSGQNNRWLAAAAVIGVILLSVAIAAGKYFPTDRTAPAAVDTADARAHYAALYDAAWRQDQGRGNVLMTATLLLPPTIVALGADTDRTDAEDQLYRLVDELAANQTAVYLTLDSVVGPVPEDVISGGLELVADGDQTWELVSWAATIRASSVSDSNIAVTPQSGVAVFASVQDIDWATIEQLVLISRGVGDQSERRFVWTAPSLLTAVDQ